MPSFSNDSSPRRKNTNSESASPKRPYSRQKDSSSKYNRFNKSDDGRQRRNYPERVPSWEKEAPPAGSDHWIQPWVQLKYFSYNPAIFPRMLGAVSTQAQAGDIVHVYDKNGDLFGSGFWNPSSKTPLRIMHHGKDPIDERALDEKLKEAVSLRRDFLKLDNSTNAYRVLHGDSDGIGGLIVDKFDDVLSLEVSTLGAWIRLPRWLPLLHKLCGTKRHIVSCDKDIARMEQIDPEQNPIPPSDPVRLVKIKENGITFEINFLEGHKTGFFCDQRDNRLRMASLLEGRSFLELCCYTGGFSIAAKLIGNSGDVTAVDLDEKAIALAKRNANINNVRVNFVHADAFTYARQMIRNGEMFDAVLLDPPKFVHGRDEYEEGLKKYHDLNSLGLQCVRPGGLFVTCSCSGLVSPDAFEHIVIKAAQRQGRKLRILDITGPGYDHPYLSTYPEGRYLKVLWAIAE